MEVKSPMMILKECFLKEGQSMTSLFAEIKEVKKLPDYKPFVEECAKHLGVEVNWS